MGNQLNSSRMRAASVWIGAILASCPAGRALADDLVLTRAAPSGIETPLAFERSWDDRCRSRGVQVTITRPPDHGSASVVPGESAIPASTPRFGSTRDCAGRKVSGDRILYRSQPGYRGPDRLSWSVLYSDGRSGRTDVTIDVK